MDSTPPDRQSHIDSYRAYKNLPTLAGLDTMRHAIDVGLSVEESVARLKRFHWTFHRLHTIFISRLTATPIYELKMAFSLHAHYCAEYITQLRTRIKEMRQPPYGFDQAPHPSLEIFFDEIQCAPTTEALVLGLYGKAVPALVRALERMLADTHKLFDHPTYRLCRFALMEMRDLLDYGDQAAKSLLDDSAKQSLAPWSATLDQLLTAAGDLDGALPLPPPAEPSSHPIERIFSKTPYKYDGVPRRDERFIDLHNAGVNAEGFLHDPQVPALPKTIMLYFKRLREIDVPEMMAGILTQTPDQPWEYYRDMTRQLWDEARHAMMGEIGFVSLGIDWTKIPISFNWSLMLNTRLKPQERHAVLFAIELGLMPRKTGKAFEWEVAQATGDRVAELIQDYDWADEILHARIGSDWLVQKLGSPARARELGNECFSRAYGPADFANWQATGLTQHRNWWPEIYSQACQRWGITPDPRLIAYNVSYAKDAVKLTSG